MSKNNEKLSIELAPSNFKMCIYCKENKLKSSFASKKQTCIACNEDRSNYKKECSRCGILKLGTEYDTKKARSYCMTCKNAETTQKEKIRTCSKECVACKQFKTAHFYKAKHKVCADCEAKPDLDYDKKCNGCGFEISIKCFDINSATCHDCVRKKNKNYRKTDIGKQNAKRQEENNSERNKELRSIHHEKNKDKINEDNREKYRTDLNHRTKIKTKSAINAMINKIITRNMANSDKYDDLLHVTQNQFETWLTLGLGKELIMNDHGETWHTDHIIPVCILTHRTFAGIHFPEEYDLSCVYSWYNIMPLDITINLSKNKFFDRKQLATHVLKLQKFVTSNKKKLALDIGDHYYTYINIVQQLIDNGSEAKIEAFPRNQYKKPPKSRKAETKNLFVIDKDTLHNVMLQTTDISVIKNLFLVSKYTVKTFNSFDFWSQKYSMLPFFPCKSIIVDYNDAKDICQGYIGTHNISSNLDVRVYELERVYKSYAMAVKFCKLFNKKKLVKEGKGYWDNSIDNICYYEKGQIDEDFCSLSAMNWLDSNLLRLISKKIPKNDFDIDDGTIEFITRKEIDMKRYYYINCTVLDPVRKSAVPIALEVNENEFIFYLAKMIYWGNKLNTNVQGQSYVFDTRELSEFLTNKVCISKKSI